MTGLASYENGSLILGNDGTQASQNGDGDYVDLPNGIISDLGVNATFETWTTWNGPEGSYWQRIFDFGASNGLEDESVASGDATYIFTTPRGGDGALRTGYRLGPTAEERVVDDTSVMAIGEEQHIAVVWNGEEGLISMYVEGQMVREGELHFSLEDFDDVNNWLGRSQWPDAMYAGSYNEFRIYDYPLTENQLYGNYLAGPETVTGGLVGDFNNNQELDVGDLDLLAAAIAGGENPAEYDLNGDGIVDADGDQIYWLHDLKSTWVGDVDLDGLFDSTDFVAVFVEGKYETGEAAGWAEGDWNADLVFSSGDFVAAFIDGGYEIGAFPGAVQAVPEPTGVALLLLGVLMLGGLRRR